MKHFWGRCKDADPSKMCFPPRRRANFQKIAAQRTNSVTNAFWVCAGAGTGTTLGAKRGFSGGSWGVLGGFLGPFSGVLPRIGAPRGHLGGVLALRAPLWDGFGASGSPPGSFFKPPEARLAPFWGPPEAVLVPFWRLQKHSKLLSLALTQIPIAMIKKYAMHGEKRGRRNGRSPHE